MNEKISVIVPIYKAENTLDRCVLSIVEQTYKNLEIILVDDGSPDNCPKMCDDWALKDDRIRVLHKELDHVCEARNLGLKYASGKYCIWIDSDDYIELKMIESMYKIAENNKADVVICNVIAHWPDNHIEKLPSLCFDTINGDEATYHMYTDDVGGRALWNKLIKKELIDELNSTFKRVSGKYSEDALFLTTIYSKCKKICSCDEHFYHYIISNNSTTRGGSITKDKLRAWIESSKIFIREFENLNYDKETKSVMYFAIAKYASFLQYTSFQMSYNDEFSDITEVLKIKELRDLNSKSNLYLEKLMIKNYSKLYIKFIHRILMFINLI